MAPTHVRAPGGLYDPSYEHDACGVAFVARLGAPASHEVISRALWALEHLEHRGAEGADADTGDGAGILIQLPDGFLRAEVPASSCPSRAATAWRCASCPVDEAERERAERLLERTVEAEGQRVLGWRDVPVVPEHCGTIARRRGALHPPAVRGRRRRRRGPGRLRAQALRDPPRGRAAQDLPDLAIASFSSRTARLQGDAHRAPAARATSPTCATSASSRRLALVHSRFSTNTFPSWELAHPYRMLAHNGEINTLRGNRNWMRARELHARLAAVRRRRREDPRRCCATTSPTRPRSTA